MLWTNTTVRTGIASLFILTPGMQGPMQANHTLMLIMIISLCSVISFLYNTLYNKLNTEDGGDWGWGEWEREWESEGETDITVVFVDIDVAYDHLLYHL